MTNTTNNNKLNNLKLFKGKTSIDDIILKADAVKNAEQDNIANKNNVWDGNIYHYNFTT